MIDDPTRPYLAKLSEAIRGQLDSELAISLIDKATKDSIYRMVNIWRKDKRTS